MKKYFGRLAGWVGAVLALAVSVADLAAERDDAGTASSLSHSAILGAGFALPASSGVKVPVSDVPVLHSRPGASRVFYLDFNGHTVADTEWNNRDAGRSRPSVPSYQAVAFDGDGDSQTFNEAEVTAMTEIWRRVAEDFSPFEVDVTTEEPAILNAWRLRVIVTQSIDRNGVMNPGASTASGAAYSNQFGYSMGEVPPPVFVYADRVVSTAQLADVISHEIGHTLGLYHDGKVGVSYYSGHAGDAPTWGPIMGAPSDTAVLTQWSKGDYYQANNPQDDLAVLAEKLGWRPDEAGSSGESATPVVMDSSTTFGAAGVVSTAEDADMFRFATGAGEISLTVAPVAGGNADLQLELFDESGQSLAVANPSQETSASLTRVVAAGTYFARTTGSGAGTPLASPPSGYTAYGSIGQYAFSGTVVAAPPRWRATSPLSVALGQPLNWTAPADGWVTSYGASGLPDGLHMAADTGVISGQPVAVGNFDVVLSATNDLGTVTRHWSLTVQEGPPAVTAQTRGLLAPLPGEVVTLTVAAVSPGRPISYQWKRDGRPIAGATTSSLTLPPASRLTSGVYWVELANEIGTSRSAPVFLRVSPSHPAVRFWSGFDYFSPLIVPGNLGRVVQIGLVGSRSLALRADGTLVSWSDGQPSPAVVARDVVTFAGYANTVAVVRTDGSTGLLSDGQAPVVGPTDVWTLDASPYGFVFLRTDGSVAQLLTSPYAVEVAPPANLGPLVGVVGLYASAVGVRADGQVQTWRQSVLTQESPVGLTGVTRLAATSSRVLALKQGGTTVAWGGAIAAPHLLSDVVALVLDSVSLALNGDGTLTVWGANGNESLPPADLRDVWDISANEGRYLAIYDAGASPLPAILTQPVGGAYVVGEAATLRVQAASGLPVSFQWRRDGEPLAGATSSVLSLSSVSATDAGSYDVVATNARGSVESAAAQIVIRTPPAITVAPARWSTPAVGSTFALSVAATSPRGPLSYQWKLNNRPIPGATAPVLEFSSVREQDAGAYTVEVTDSDGVVARATGFLRPEAGPTQLRGWGTATATSVAGLTTRSDLVAVSASYDRSLALTRDGTVLPLGSSYSSFVPTGLEGVAALSTGSLTNLALRQDGRVALWGNYGQDGPVPPENLDGIIAVTQSVQGYLLGAVRQDGRAVVWGWSLAAPFWSDVGAVSALALGEGALALKVDGTVVKLTAGGPAVPEGLAGVVAIAAGERHALALKADGTVVAWGANDRGQTSVPVGLNGVVAITAGSNVSWAVKADGTVVGWGDAAQTVLANLPPDLAGVTAVSIKDSLGYALRRAESDAAPSITAPPVATMAVAGEATRISVATSGAAPLLYEWYRDGELVQRGFEPVLWQLDAAGAAGSSYTVKVSNHLGQVTSAPLTVALTLPPSLTSVPPRRLSPALGATFTLSVAATSPHGPFRYQWKRDNRLLNGATAATFTQANFRNADAGAYTVEVIDARGAVARATTFVLPSYGPAEVQVFGSNSSSDLRQVPPGITDVVRLEQGARAAMAVSRDGQIAAWGMNYGADLFAPANVNLVRSAVAGALTYQQAAVVNEDGTVTLWGNDYSGQLLTAQPALTQIIATALRNSVAYFLRADGHVIQFIPSTAELSVVEPERGPYAAMAINDSTMLLLKTDGTVIALGNTSGANAVPSGLSKVTAIAASYGHFLALKTDGTVVAWGENTYQQATVPAGLSDVVAISALGQKSLALRADGTAVRWGLAENNQPVLPGDLALAISVDGGEVGLRRTPNDGVPTITTAPIAPGLRAAGSDLSLRVAATGPGSLRYQWRHDGLPISGANAATLILTSLQISDAGRYDVEVSNHVGTITSVPVALAVGLPPTITDRPARRVVAEVGQPLTLDVTATSLHGPLSYQWKKNNRPLPGQTASTLTLPGFSASEAGAYTLEVSDTRGLVSRVTTFVLASQGETILRVWGTANSGQANMPEAEVARTVAISVGTYHVAALQADGRVVVSARDSSGAARVMAVPGVSDAVAVAAGENSTLILLSDGRVVRLLSDGTYAVVDGLKAIIAIAATGGEFAAVNDEGRVAFSYFYASGSSSVPSDQEKVSAVAMNPYARIYLHVDGTVSQQLLTTESTTVQTLTMPAELTDVATVAAGGLQAMALRSDGALRAWGRNSSGVALGAGTTQAVAAGADFGLALLADRRVVAWSGNSVGSVIQPPADLADVRFIAAGGSVAVAVCGRPSAPPPTITEAPQSVRRAVGESVTFRVSVTGAGVIFYQWRRNGEPVAGATASSLTLPSVQATDFGTYDVVVTDRGGTVTSAPASLTESAPLMLTSTPPQQVSVAMGAALSLTAPSTTGTGPFTYRWKLNNRPISGAVSATLTQSNFAATQAGAYTVEITDATGATVRHTTFVRPNYRTTELAVWGEPTALVMTLPFAFTDAVAVAASSNRSLVLRANGTVVEWGATVSGGTPMPSGLANVVAIAMGPQHALALRADGTVVGWGVNTYGQATPPADLREVIAIKAGDQFSVALKADGTVVTWGPGAAAALKPPGTLREVSSIAAGGAFVLALGIDGTVTSWGTSSYALSTVPATATDVVAVSAAANLAVALRANGQVVLWGNTSYGLTNPSTALPLFSAVDIEQSYAVGISQAGMLHAWGLTLNVLVTPPAGFTRVLEVAAGSMHGVAIRDSSDDLLPSIVSQPQSQVGIVGSTVTFSVMTSGEIAHRYQWRRNGVPIPGATTATLRVPAVTAVDDGSYDVLVSNGGGTVASQVATLVVRTLPSLTATTPVRQVVADGQPVSLAVDVAGAAPFTYAWSFNNRPIAGATSSSYGIAAMNAAAAGAYTVVVTDSVGLVARKTFFVLPDLGRVQVRSWGATLANQAGQVGGLHDVVALSAGYSHALALRANGRVVAWGASTAVPADLTDVVAIAAGASQSYALKSDGTVTMWSNSTSSASGEDIGVRDVIDIQAAGSRLLVLRSDGTAIYWVSTTYSEVLFTGITQIAFGGNHALGRRIDGTVVGSKFSNGVFVPDAAVPSDLGAVRAIAAGGDQSVALREDGRLVLWGGNSSSLAIGLTLARAVECGVDFSMMIDGEGRLWAWGGFNSNGQRNIPGDLGTVRAFKAGNGFALALRAVEAGEAPVIVTPPQSAVRSVRERVNFTVTATGLGPLSYQWRRGDTPIPGATSAILTVANLTSADAGNYLVEVSNVAGTTTSAAATLTISAAPEFLTAPSARSLVTVGGSLQLSAEATSTNLPVSYRWKFNNRLIPGATSATFTLENFTAAQAGAYTVEATDALGLVARRTGFVLPDFARTELVVWSGSVSETLRAVPTTLRDAVAVSFTGQYGLALRKDGSLSTWGPQSASVANVPTTLSDAVAVAGGNYFGAALRADGTVVTWSSLSSNPVPVPDGLREVIALVAGDSHLVALRSDGTVVAWGSSSSTVAVPMSLDEVVQVSAEGSVNVALRADGRVVVFGSDVYGLGTNAPAQTGYTTIDASPTVAVGLDAEGVFKGWGSGSGSVPTPPTNLGALRTVLVSSSVVASLSLDGKVVLWGTNAPAVPGGLTRVFAIGLRGSTAFALRDASADLLPVVTQAPLAASVMVGLAHEFSVTVADPLRVAYQWRKDGVPLAGATAATLRIHPVTAASAGDYDVVVTNPVGAVTTPSARLTVDSPPSILVAPPARVVGVPSQPLQFSVTVAPEAGSVSYQWTRNNRPIDGATSATLTLPDFANEQAGAYTVEVTDQRGSVARRTTFVLPNFGQAQLVAWGTYFKNLQTHDAPTDLVAVSAGQTSVLAIRGDGTLWHRVAQNYSSATPPSDVANAVAVVNGRNHGLALRSDGTVVGWGGTSHGEATPPADLGGVIAIAAGEYFSAALKSDGTVVTWGIPQLAPPAGLDQVVKIAAGESFMLALRRDGRVVAWGSSSYGVNQPPLSLTGVVDVAAGGSVALALQADGQAVVWGAYPRTVFVREPQSVSVSEKFLYSVDAAGNLRNSNTDTSAVVNQIPSGLGRVFALSANSESVAVLRDMSTHRAPAIEQQPVGGKFTLGQRVVLRAVANGTPTLQFQWSRDGVAIADATAAVLILPELKPGEAGSYSLTVRNHVGSVMSLPAVVELVAGPTLVSRPSARQIVAPGAAAELAVAVTSEHGPLGYQWTRNNQPIAGATSATLRVENFSRANAGAYTLEITDARGVVTRLTSFVQVDEGVTQVVGWGNTDATVVRKLAETPTSLNDAVELEIGEAILARRANGTVQAWGGNTVQAARTPIGLTDVVKVAAGTIMAALRADGTVHLWGGGIDNATAKGPTGMRDVIAVAAGSNHVLALRNDGSVVGWTANGSFATLPPADLEGVIGVEARGQTSVLRFKDGRVVIYGSDRLSPPPAGETGLTEVQVGGSYALASRADGSLFGWGSASYNLTTIPSTAFPLIAFDANDSLAVAAKTDGTVVAWGATDGRATVPSGLGKVFEVAAGPGMGFALRHAGDDVAPAIATQPSALAVGAGGVAIFRVEATGTERLIYQWRRNGAPLSTGGTGATLSLANVQAADAGAYDVVVTNHVGSMVSQAAELSVGQPPSLTTVPPARVVVNAGAPLELSVTATSSDIPLSYQWKKNNRPITGATAATLTLASLAAGEGGAFTVEVRDSVGRVTRHTSFVHAVPALTQVVAWGSSSSSARSIPADLGRVAGLTTGNNTVIAITAEGRAVAWGGVYTTLQSSLASLTEVVAVAATQSYGAVLRADGAVTMVGSVGSSLAVPAGLREVVAIAIGSGHVLALKSDGRVVAWGNNYSGEATVPAGLSEVVAIRAQGSVSMALKADGTIVGWGSSSYSLITGAAAVTGASLFEVSNYLALAAKSGGTWQSWGSNFYGIGTVPATVGAVKAFALGTYHAVALTSDDRVVAWGSSSPELTTIPAEFAGAYAVGATSDASLVLRDASADVAPSITTQPVAQTISAGGTAVFSVVAGPGPLTYQWRFGGVAIVGGTAATLSVANVGPASVGNYDVVVRNHVGAVTSAPAALQLTPRPLVTVPLARRHTPAPGESIALSVSATGIGNLSYQWKRNGRIIPGATSSVLSIAAATRDDTGYYFCVVSDENGSTLSDPSWVTVVPADLQVVAWGLNTSGQTTLPATLAPVGALAAGGSHSVAIGRDGKVTSWGYSYPQPSSGVTLGGVVAVAAAEQQTLTLHSDATVRRWGSTGMPSEGLGAVVAVAAGSTSALALRTDGTVVEWSSTRLNVVPATVRDVTRIAAGFYHFLALKTDGTVVAWGSNHNGQTNVPGDLIGVKAVAAGSGHSLALKEDGTVVAWGDNTYGAVNVPAGLANVVEIAAGAASSFALQADGTVVAWGRNQFGETSLPVGLNRVWSLASGGMNSHLLVIRDRSEDLPPIITLNPSGGTMSLGASHVFSVTATGGQPLTYQWRLNGVDISGATGPALSLVNLQAPNAGSYDVVVKNSRGTATSAAAVLSILQPPAVTFAHARRLTPSLGERVTVTAQVSGASAAATYRWKKNNRPISGATSLSYTIPSFGNADAGAYTLEVTDGDGLKGYATVFLAASYERAHLWVWGNDPYGLAQAPQLNRISGFAVSSNYAGVVRHDGSLAMWGYQSSLVSGRPSGPVEFVALAIGSGHALALTSAGRVVAWGDNSYGQTTVPVGMENVIAVAAGANFSAALRADGSVVIWGERALTTRAVPADLTDVAAIFARKGYAAALRTDGTIRVWGENSYGTLSPPVDLTAVTSLSLGDEFALALKADGTVIAWGSGSASANNGAASQVDVVAIAAGRAAAYALKADGSITTWGSTSFGSNPAPVGVGVAQQIGAAEDMAVALRDSAGDAAPVITVQPVSLAAVAGNNYAFSVTATGAGKLTYQWRFNGTPLSSQTASLLNLNYVGSSAVGTYDVMISNHVGTTISAPATLRLPVAPIISPASGHSRQFVVVGQPATLGFDVQGEGAPSFRWKKDNRPIVGATSSSYTIPSFSWADAGAYTLEVTYAPNQVARATLFVLPSGVSTEITQWGPLGSGIAVPSGLKDAVKVAAGEAHRLALRSNGELVAWGDSSLNQATIPATAAGEAVAVAAGGYHSLVLKSDGSVSAWGLNDWRQTDVPSSATSGIAVAAGYDFSLVLRHDGSVVAWGGNASYPPTTTNTVALAAGGYHALALRADGTVLQWGDTTRGQAVPPSGLGSVVAIAAGHYHSLALKDDGSVVAWGRSTEGQINVPSGLTGVVAIAAGGNTSVAMKADGSCMVWGATDSSFAPLAQPDSSRVALTAGSRLLLTLNRGDADSAPVILQEPTSAVVTFGATHVLRVQALSAGALSYQWFRNGQRVEDDAVHSGANTDSLRIAEFTQATNGDYSVRVTSGAGYIDSTVATLVVGRRAQTIAFVAIADQPFGFAAVPLHATASSGLPVSYSVVAGPAVATGSSLTLLGTGGVTVRATQAGSAEFFPAEAIEQRFVVSRSFEAWSLGAFNSTELGDMAMSGPQGDPDRDGLANLLEYALGRDPKLPSRESGMQIQASATEWIFTYSRPIDRLEVGYVVEISNNLHSWSATQVIHEKMGSDGETETWRARVPLSAGANVFFRLRVTQ